MTEGAIEQSSGSGADEPPAMLQHAVDAAPPFDSVRANPAVSSMHQSWARVDAAGGQGARGRVAGALARLAPAGGNDRMLIGELIRATDALAARCDELADRVMALEGALAEVIEVFGADLTRMRAAASRGSERGEVHSPHE